METLVKIDSKNKIRILNIWVKGASLNQSSGLLGGTLVENTRLCTPKNVGRSNETSGAEQAVMEMQSKILKKQDETYIVLPHSMTTDSELMLGAKNSVIRDFIASNSKKIPKAMLAKTYQDRYADYTTGVWVSPKLDGQRAMSPLNEMWSRPGKGILTMDHIKQELATKLTGDFNHIIPDGELYMHDKGAENFQDIIKAIKKYRPGVSELVQYWVYDLVDEHMPASLRHGMIQGLFSDMVHVKVVPQYLCYSKAEVLKYHEQFLAEGYEGTMIKNGNSLYRQNARSSDLLKLKDFQDAEYRIVDVIPMKNRPECGIMVMEDTKGRRFKATPKGDYLTRVDYLKSKTFFIGSMGTVQFFSLTDDGIPRFPVFKAVRD